MSTSNRANRANRVDIALQDLGALGALEGVRINSMNNGVVEGVVEFSTAWTISKPDQVHRDQVHSVVLTNC